MNERAVVTGFLRHEGEILLLRRSNPVDTDRGQWDVVTADTLPGDGTEATMAAAIAEETGIDPHDCERIRVGEPFTVTDRNAGIRWQITPFLFESPTAAVTLTGNHTAFEWVKPTEILRRETAPGLWRSYDAVRPRVETITDDETHGSAYISLRALELLRDEAGLLAYGSDKDRATAFESIDAVWRALLDARPAMTVVANRINRAMPAVEGEAENRPEAVEKSAHETLKAAATADERAASGLQQSIDDARVATLSRSGTVLDALDTANPDTLLVAESRPGREGVVVAEQFAADLPVSMTSDAAFPQELLSFEADLLVVGADAVFPDGTVRNKVGTRPAATVAARAGIPVVVVAAADKISPKRIDATEQRPTTELYDGPAPISVENPTFDLTPPGVIDRYVTDRGKLYPREVRGVADEHAARWPDDGLSE